MEPVVDADAPPRANAMRRVILIGLLLLGGQLWLLSDFWLYRPLWRIAIYVAALALCFVPAVQRAIAWAGASVEPRGRWRTPLIFGAIVVASVAALYATALASDRQFTPIFHDEFTYLLQARMFASGRLWMPPHPLGEFFETFYVITDRAYAAQYFPGAAILFAPGALLGLSGWVMPLIVAGLACGAMFLLMRELFGGAVGLASVVVLVGVLPFRVLSITPVSQVPAMLLATIGLFALLRWDRARGSGWIVATGVAFGWLAVTRPLEGVVCGTLGAAFVALRSRGAPSVQWRRVALAGLLPVVPFVVLQLALNRGITGRWLQTPFAYYAAVDMPGTELGFHGYDPSSRPASALPQKQEFFDLQVATAVREHSFASAVLDWPRRRFFNATTEIFADMLLVVVVPAALLALRDPRRWLVLLVMPLWWAAYTLHVFHFSHYYVFYSASIFVLIFAGFDGIASCLGPRGARAMRAAQVVMPVVISVMVMPQFKRDVRDQWYANPAELTLERGLAALPAGERAIVIVRYDATAIPEQEVVYNVDAAWPDDARHVRAHDLGDGRNVALYRYYARLQPDRVVYRFERKDNTLHRLGRVTELAAPASRAASAPTMTR